MLRLASAARLARTVDVRRRHQRTIVAAAAGSAALPYPRAAVAALALRPAGASGPEVLLVRRGAPPHAGAWSYPGGSLELGETILAGAARELKEETGVSFLQAAAAGRGRGRALAAAGPVAFTASDAIERDPSSGGLAFHYAIVQVAGLAGEGADRAAASDDAAAVAWARLADVAAGRGPPGGPLTPGCAGVASEALARFGAEFVGQEA